MPSEKMKYIRRSMEKQNARRADITYTPLKEEIEAAFSPANIDDDCNTIASLLRPYGKMIDQLLDCGDVNQAITILLEILESQAYHFVADEHYNYFDDMYVPDYECEDMLNAIIAKIKDGTVSDEEQDRLDAGMQQIEQTECYKGYYTPSAVNIWKKFKK